MGIAASAAWATRQVPAVSAARRDTTASGMGTAACPATATPRVWGAHRDQCAYSWVLALFSNQG